MGPPRGVNAGKSRRDSSEPDEPDPAPDEAAAAWERAERFGAGHDDRQALARDLARERFGLRRRGH